jgi:hypothetical protein
MIEPTESIVRMCNSFAAIACGAIKNRMFVYAVFTKRVLVKFQPLVKRHNGGSRV